MINVGPIIFLFISLFGFSQEDHMLIYDYSAYVDEDVQVEEKLTGMVVPHHILAVDMMERMYGKVQPPKHILLISPDHFLNARRKITISAKDWAGYFGKVQINRPLTIRLSDEPYVTVNDEEILKEHGINTHIPLIAKHFPEADLVNVTISKETTVDELNSMISLLPEDIFIIASVDFSHYLSYEEASVNDDVTQEMMAKGVYMDFFKMNDGYFDSPGSLYVIFKVLGDDYEIYENKNAFDYLGVRYNTTSYMTIGFKDND